MLLPPPEQHTCDLPLKWGRPGGWFTFKRLVPDGDYGYTWDCRTCGAVWMITRDDAGDLVWRGADMNTAFKHRQRATEIRLRELGHY